MKEILKQASKEDLKFALKESNELYQTLEDIVQKNMPNHPPEIIYFNVITSIKNEVIERLLDGRI